MSASRSSNRQGNRRSKDLVDVLICIGLAGLFVLLSSGTAFSQGNVGINNPTPHAKSLLDLTSSDKGLLAPRMTAAQRTAMFPAADATAEGMLVYQTDGTQGFYYYDGAAWVFVNPGTTSNDWALAGNAGTNPATQFVGTTDAQPLVVRTNNIERARIDTDGDLGLGVTNPVWRIDAQANQAVARFTSTNHVYGSVVELKNATAGNNVLGAVNFSEVGVTPGQLAYHTTDGMTFRTGLTERMRILPTGNIGIGTTTPTYGLHILRTDALTNLGLRNLNDNSISGTHYYGSGGSLLGATGWANNGNPYTPNSLVHGTLANSPATFITNTIERMRITGAGNVGIGNVAPASKLHVTVGNAGYAPSAQSGLTLEGSGHIFENIISGTGGTGVLFGSAGTAVSGGVVYNLQGGYPNALELRTGGNTTRLSITDQGNVAIGTSTFQNSCRLSVHGANPGPLTWQWNNDNAGLSGSLYSSSAAIGSGVTGWANSAYAVSPNTLLHGTLNSTPVTFMTNSTERMRIAPNGFVGIGTNAPLASVHVAASTPSFRLTGNNNGMGTILTLENTMAGASLLGQIGFVDGTNTAQGVISYRTNYGIQFSTDATTRMTITPTGNIGVGETFPQDALHVAGNIRMVDGSQAAGYVLTSDANGRGTWQALPNAGTSAWGLTGNAGTNTATNFIGTTDGQPLALRTSNAERMRISATGQVGIGTAAPTADLEVNGYTKLGSDAPAIKVKKLTGTTANAQGNFVDIVHGVTGSKIIGVQVLIEYGPGFWIPTSYSNQAGYSCNFIVQATSIRIINEAGNSASMLSKPVKILITYEQ